ncbi:MAG: glycerate kinase, partial [Clostridia bacterium]
MRIALMPDSFKGTLSAIKISEIMRSAIESIVDAQTIMLPIADGGEGSIDAISLALSGNKIHKTVRDAYLNEIDAYYYLSGDTAIVEVATCIGLPLISIHNPALTSSYGVGELIKDAMDKGAHRIILALGGSSTNDGGCGIASALGVRFSKSSGGFLPTGGTLSQIEDIDIAQLDKRINNVEFVSMCDIDNPLYGEQGAAYVYARQKGADDEMIKSLDKGLR